MNSGFCAYKLSLVCTWLLIFMTWSCCTYLISHNFYDFKFERNDQKKTLFFYSPNFLSSHSSQVDKPLFHKDRL